MAKELEKKFTEEDINNLTALMFRAVKLTEKPQDYPKEWMSEVIEQLKPYAFNGNTAEKIIEDLEIKYKKIYEEEYASSKL